MGNFCRLPREIARKMAGCILAHILQPFICNAQSKTQRWTTLNMCLSQAMSLDSALSIATGGLANINAQFALISQNVANAATPGYAVEVGNQQALTASGVGMGVQTEPATLQIDQTLQSPLVQQNAAVSAGQTTQTALQSIDSVLGTPGSGSDLGSLLGNLQDGFSTLLTDPSNQAQQSTVVSDAASLAQGINTLSAAYGTQSQAAQDGIVSEVSTLNSTLASIGQISAQIIALKPTNQSVADLENERNAQVQTLSQLVNVKTVEQPNGDLSIFTASGLSLPTQDGASPFSIANATTSPGAYYPGGGLPGITLGGVDVTSQMSGGQIGANVTLRDTTLPTAQAALDEFSQGLSDRFAAQGLTLFTSPSGSIPVAAERRCSPAMSDMPGPSRSIRPSPPTQRWSAMAPTQPRTSPPTQRADRLGLPP
jgi:flagellar hook-associated protein 1 FlgK